MLRAQYKILKPTHWFFEGQFQDTPFSEFCFQHSTNQGVKKSWNSESCNLILVKALVCNTPDSFRNIGMWDRPAVYPGDIGSFELKDNGDLYACEYLKFTTNSFAI